MAANQPGCLTQLALTFGAAFLALAGIEVWLDRYAWPVDPSWYRLEVADGYVSFTCQNFEPVRFSVKPEKRRIAVLGGSTTFGYPERKVGTAPATEMGGFVGALQRGIPQVEFVDLGINGGNSVDTLRVWRRAVDWGAETVVVYDGHNEFMDMPPSAIAPLWRFSLYRQFASLLPRTMVSPGPVGAPSYGSAANREAVLARFRHNLEAIVDLAQEHEIKVVLVTQAANLAGFDPSWSATGEAADGEWAQGRLAANVVGVDRGSINGEDTDGGWAQGRAQEVLQAATDHDGLPFRATSEINAVIGEVARARGVALVEAAQDIGVTEPSEFYDWVHLTPGAAARLASRIAWELDVDLDSGAFRGRQFSAEIYDRVAAGWLQWACVRQHDPAFRLQNAAAWANGAMMIAPADPEAKALYALATHAPVTADEPLRTKLSHIHPCVAERLK